MNKETLIPLLAIDGPSGVGKGTLARCMAAELGWHLLDSGALYRILALAVDRSGIDPHDADAVAAVVPALTIEFKLDGDSECILLDGEDISAQVRDEQTGNMASVIAVHPPVRAALLDLQRRFRRAPGLVADGRDMGTEVFTDASVKVFLDASAEVRARRRAKQLLELGIDANLDRLCEEIRERDDRDRNRTEAPLRPAEDAEIIDTSELGIGDVVCLVRELVAKNCSK